MRSAEPQPGFRQDKSRPWDWLAIGTGDLGFGFGIELFLMKELVDPLLGRQPCVPHLGQR